MQLAYGTAAAPTVVLSLQVTSLDGSAATCTETDNGALSLQDVRSNQPPARGTPSTASGRPLTHDRYIGAV